MKKFLIEQWDIAEQIHDKYIIGGDLESLRQCAGTKMELTINCSIFDTNASYLMAVKAYDRKEQSSIISMRNIEVFTIMHQDVLIEKMKRSWAVVQEESGN